MDIPLLSNRSLIWVHLRVSVCFMVFPLLPVNTVINLPVCIELSHVWDYVLIRLDSKIYRLIKSQTSGFDLGGEVRQHRGSVKWARSLPLEKLLTKYLELSPVKHQHEEFIGE